MTEKVIVLSFYTIILMKMLQVEKLERRMQKALEAEEYYVAHQVILMNCITYNQDKERAQSIRSKVEIHEI